jgi:hypothetical protein
MFLGACFSYLVGAQVAPMTQDLQRRMAHLLDGLKSAGIEPKARDRCHGEATAGRRLTTKADRLRGQASGEPER